MKDKIKQNKIIDDNSNIISSKDTDTFQCPYCLGLFHIGTKHECKVGHHVCTICGLNLTKKEKTHIWHGIKMIRFRYKKSFNIMNKVVCWECAFKLVKQFKNND